MLVTRWLTPDDTDAIDQACALTARVFSGGSAEVAATLRATMLGSPFLRAERCGVVEDAGRVVAKWQLLTLRMRVAGIEIPVAGAHALACAPEDRGRGHVERLIAFGFAETARSHDLFVGFARRGAIYDHLGGVVLAEEPEWSADARAVPPLAPDDFRPLAPDDLPRLLALRARDDAERAGTIVRTAGAWPWLDRRPQEIWTAPDGYLGVRAAPDGYEVREVAGDGASFFARAVAKLAELARAHGGTRVFGHLPADHPMVAAAAPLGGVLQLRASRHAGLMGGVLDLPRFLDRIAPALERRLPPGVAVRLRLGVDRLELHLGPTSVAPTPLALPLEPGALLQLCFGHQSAGTLLAARGETLDADTLRLADRLFPPGHPFMWPADRW